MKSVLKWISLTIAALLLVCGVLFIMLVAYYFPVIDRAFIRPCHYYPNAFADCQKN